MSSWFNSFFGSNPNSESTQVPKDHQPSTDDSSAVISPTSAIPGLTDDQKEQIREVIKKAELSKQSAKYVVDPRNMEKLKLQNKKSSSSTNKNYDSFDEINFEECDMLVQMDSLPETIEVTLGPSYGGSAMSLNNSEYENKSNEKFEKDISHDITKSMKMITMKIAEWVKSMEQDEEHIQLTRNELHQISKQKESPETLLILYNEFEADVDIEDYCNFVSRQAVILALAEYLQQTQTKSDAALAEKLAVKISTEAMTSAITKASETLNKKNIEFFPENITSDIMKNIKTEINELEPQQNECSRTIALETRTDIITDDTTIAYQILRNKKRKKENLSPEQASSSATSGADNVLASSSTALSTEQQVNYERGSPLIDLEKISESDEIVPPPRPQPPPAITKAVQQLSLTEEELAHINYIKQLAEQSSFEKQPIPIKVDLTKSISIIEPEMEKLSPEQASSSATSGADNVLPSSSTALSTEQQVNYERGSPLIDLEKISESDEIVPPPRPQPPPAITKAVQQLSLTEEELAHINYIKQLAEQSSFEKQPIKVDLTKSISITEPEIEKLSLEHASSSATSGADNVLASSSTALSTEQQVNYERGSPLIDLEKISESDEIVPPPRPQPPPAITKAVQQLSLTEEELAHINYIKQLAEQSSFEKQPIPIKVDLTKSISIIEPEMEKLSPEQASSSATSGADNVLPSSSTALSTEQQVNYERGSPLIDLEKISESDEIVPPPRPQPPPAITKAVQQLSLTEEELAHINYIKQLAEQSSFEKQPIPIKVDLTKSISIIEPEIEKLSPEQASSSATSGADNVLASSSTALSTEQQVNYERGSPLIDLEKISESGEIVPPLRPQPPPAITKAVQQLSLTEEELAHINYIKQLAEQSSFEKQPIPIKVDLTKSISIIEPEIEKLSPEQASSSATSGADNVLASSSTALSTEQQVNYERGSPLIDLEKISESGEIVPPLRPQPPPAITKAVQQLSLTEEELAHINYIKQLAEQSSFEKQPIPIKVDLTKSISIIEPEIEKLSPEQASSSATSGADNVLASSSTALSTEQQVNYERGSPLIDLEKISESDEIVPPPRPQPPPAITKAVQQLSLTEEELAHINYIKQLAEQSSFEKQPIPIKVDLTKSISIIEPEIEKLSPEQASSSATSGADNVLPSSSTALSTEQQVNYERGSPLIDLEKISESDEIVPPPRPQPPPAITKAVQQLSLTEEELAHINYIKQLAEQSSFEKQPIKVDLTKSISIIEPETEKLSLEQASSSATSGADNVLASSSTALSTEQQVNYERGSPLIDLEKISESDEIVPPPRPQPPPAITKAVQQLSLTEEELAHINYIKQLAEQSSFEKQPIPIKVDLTKSISIIEPEIEKLSPEQASSSATSGADNVLPSSSTALSTEQQVNYERGSPLIDLEKISESDEIVPPPRPQPPPAITKAVQQLSLTEEELAHINYIKQLAEQSSFEKQPIKVDLTKSISIIEPETEKLSLEQASSSATSGADNVLASSSTALSTEQQVNYERGSPLIDLEKISKSDEIVPPPRPQPPPAITKAVQQLSLTEEELAHINYIKQLAEQSSFEKQPIPIKVDLTKSISIIEPEMEKLSPEQASSSATSGADNVLASSSTALSTEQQVNYERGSPLIDLEKISESGEIVPPLRPQPPPAITKAVQQLSLTEEELAHINYIKQLAEQSSFEKQPIPIKVDLTKSISIIEPEIEKLSPEQASSSATSGADNVLASSSTALSTEQQVNYERGSPLIDLEKISESDEIVPPPRPQPPPAITKAVQQLSLTEEELAHINYIKQLAEQSSFEKQPIPIKVDLTKSISIIEPETEKLSLEQASSSATSGADNVLASSSTALSTEQQVNYERGSPLIDLEKISESGDIVPPLRPQPPPAITKAVQQLSLTEEELAHINYIKQLAEQSSFEKQPIKVDLTKSISIIEPEIEKLSPEQASSSATSGADNVLASSSTALSTEQQVNYERGSPLIDLEKISESDEIVPPPRPQPPPAITKAVQQLSLTEEELAHINYIKQLAEQSSFEKQPIPIKVDLTKSISIIEPEIEKLSPEQASSSATSGADNVLPSSSTALSTEQQVNYERGSPLIDLEKISESDEIVPPPRPQPPPAITKAVQQLSLTEEELAHINYIKQLAEQSSFEKQPIKVDLTKSISIIEPETEKLSLEQASSSATSGADNVLASSSTALSTEQQVNYERGSPLIDLEKISESDEIVPPPRPQPPPAITKAVQQLSLTEEELAHINYIKQLAEQSSFEKQPIPIKVDLTKSISIIEPEIEKLSPEQASSSATSGADNVLPSSSTALSTEQQVNYERGSPLIDLEKISESDEIVPPPRPQPPPAITKAVQQLSLTEEELAHINYIKQLAEQSSFEKQPIKVDLTKSISIIEPETEKLSLEQASSSATSGADNVLASSSTALSTEQQVNYERGSPLIDLEKISKSDEIVPPPRPQPPPAITKAVQQLSLTEEELAHINYIKQLAEQSSFEKQPIKVDLTKSISIIEPEMEKLSPEQASSSATSGADNVLPSSSTALSTEQQVNYERGSPLIDLEKISESDEIVPPPRPQPPPAITKAVQQLSLTEEELAHINYIKQLAEQSSFEKQPIKVDLTKSISIIEPEMEKLSPEQASSSATSGADNVLPSSSTALSTEQQVNYERGSPLIDLEKISESDEIVPPPRPQPPPAITKAVQQLSLTEEELAHINYIKQLAEQSSFEKQPIPIKVDLTKSISIIEPEMEKLSPEQASSSATSGADNVLPSSSTALSTEQQVNYERGSPLIDLEKISESDEIVPPPRPQPPPAITKAVQQLSLTEEELAHINYIKQLAEQSSFEKQPIPIKVDLTKSISIIEPEIEKLSPEQASSSATSGADNVLASSSTALSTEQQVNYERGSPLIDLEKISESDEIVPPPRPQPPPAITKAVQQLSLTEEELAHINYIKQLAEQSSFEKQPIKVDLTKSISIIEPETEKLSLEQASSSATSGADNVLASSSTALSTEQQVNYERGSPLIDLEKISESDEIVPPPRPQPPPAITKAVQQLSLTEEELAHINYIKQLAEQSSFEKQPIPIKVDLTKSISIIEPEIEKLSPEQASSSATSGADNVLASSSTALSTEQQVNYERGSPLIDLEKISESDEIVPPPRPQPPPAITKAVQQLSLTEEELAHINYIKQLAEQSSFEKQPIKVDLTKSISIIEPETEKLSLEQASSSATSGADNVLASSSTALSTEQQVNYERGSPLIDLEKISESGDIVPPLRPQPPPAITKAVQQLSLTEEELAHINYIKQLAEQSSFEKQPIKVDLTKSISIIEPETEKLSLEQASSSATSGADNVLASSSTALSTEQQVNYERGSPLIDLEKISESDEIVPPPRPQPPPAITKAVQQLSLTEEELAHINYIKQLAEQSSFEKQPIPIKVDLTKSISIIEPEIEKLSPEQASSSATSGADNVLASSSTALSTEQQVNYERGSPLIDLEKISESDEIVPPPRPQPPPAITKAVQQLSLTEEELAHINYIKQLAEQSSFEKQPIPIKVDLTKSISIIEPEIEKLSPEQASSSATSGADNVLASSSTALSTEQQVNYERGSPLIDLEKISESGEIVPPLRPQPPPAITKAVQQLSLTEEELAHINYIKQLAEQSSFEKQPIPIKVDLTKSISIIEPEIEKLSLEHASSSATSGADNVLASSSTALSTEQQVNYERGSPLIDLEKISESDEIVPPPRPQPPPAITKAVQQLSLTEEELAHINYIKQLAEQSSFEKQPIKVDLTKSISIIEPEIEKLSPEQASSSATSGADNVLASSSTALSTEQQVNYERGSPLIDLEKISESDEIVPPPRPQPPPAITKAVQQLSLTEEELAHINYIKQLAEQSSFEKQPIKVDLTKSISIIEPEIEKLSPEQASSSATSGADNVLASSSTALSTEQQVNYERGSPLIDLEKISESDEIVPPPRPQPPPAITKAVQQLSLTEEELAHINYIKQLAEQSSFEKQPIPIKVDLTKSISIIEPEIEKLSPEQASSSATSGADNVLASSSTALSTEQQVNYERGSPLIDLEKISESDEIVPPPRPQPPPAITKAVQQLSLTEEELAHINYIKQLAEQSSFEKQPIPIKVDLTKSISIIEPEIEKLSPEQASSSATSGADNVLASSSTALSTEQQVNYERGSPLIDLEKISESGEIVPPLRPQPPPAITKAVQQLSLTEEELAHINYIKQLAEQSSFEKQPIPIKVDLTKSISIIEPEIEKLSPEQASSSATSGADNVLASSSTALSTEQQVNYERGSPLIDLEKISESDEIVPPPRPQPPPAITKAVQQLSLTEEELAHINYIKQLAEQCSFEKQPIPIKVDLNFSTWNPFSDCEARASIADSHELCNVDFMVKLNFFAQRMTENIAEMAANDLVAKIRFFQNPRARYFDDDATIMFPNDDDSSVEESDYDRSQAGDFFSAPLTLEKEIKQNSSFLHMNMPRTYFDRPKSAMAAFAISKPVPLEGNERKSTAERKSSPGGDILNLISRSSMSIDKNNDSPIKLPDDALAGLTDDEKEHILKVLAAANRSQCTPQQSRSSSAMHVLSDLDTLNVDENERKHIEEVILKAEQRESPFVIKSATEDRRQISPDERHSAVTENLRWPFPEISVQSPVRSSADIYPMRRILERIDSQSEVSSEHPATPRSDFTPSEANDSTTNLFGTNFENISNTNRRNSLSPSLLFGNLQSKLSPLPSPSLFRGSRRLSAPVTCGNIYSPFSPDKSENINEISEEDLPVDEKTVVTEIIRDKKSDTKELTQEELEHIMKVNEMARLALEETPPLSAPFAKSSSTQKIQNKPSIFGALGLSKVTSTMEKISSATNAVYSTFDATKSIPQVSDLEKVSTQAILPVNTPVSSEKISRLLEETILTEEEMEHINRIAAMAEQESVNYSKVTEVKKNQLSLTKEELEHIERITKMAEMEMNNIPNFTPTYLDQLELVTDSAYIVSEQQQLPLNKTENEFAENRNHSENIIQTEEHEENGNLKTFECRTELAENLANTSSDEENRMKNIEKIDYEKGKVNIVETASKLSTFGFGTFKKAKQLLTKTAEQVSETLQQKPLDEGIGQNQSDIQPSIENLNFIPPNEVLETSSNILQPSNEDFWTENVLNDNTDIAGFRTASIDSAFSLEKTDDSYDTSNSENQLVTTVSDYDMADDNKETVRTFQWYEQQLSQMNKSLDEDFGLHPELEKHEHNGVSLLPSISFERREQALTNYTTQPHLLKNEWGEEERHLKATGVEEKINELAAAEVNRALQAATEEILEAFEKQWQPLQQQLPQQIALGEKYSGDEKRKEEEKEKEEKSSFTEPFPSKLAVDATTFQVENKPESHAIVSSKCDEIDISISNQSNIPKIEKKEFTMFGSKSKSGGGFGGFGGLSKFASSALQNAKQAGEQIGAKAAQAAQAASTGDLTQVGKVLQQPQNLQTKPPTRSQSSFLPVLNTNDINIPPGLENLSQEERDKIMAVMACAEIDAGPMLPPKPISASLVEEKLPQPPVIPPSQKSSSLLNLSEVSNIAPISSRPITPSIEELGLSNLTPAEQEQILSVMRNAEMQDMSSTSMPIQLLVSPNKPAATIVHEQLNDRDGSRTRKLSWETSGQLIPEQIPSPVSSNVEEEKSPSPPMITSLSPVSTIPQRVVVSDSGYITSPGYENENEKSFLQSIPFPPPSEEIKESMLPESFEIDEEPEEHSLFGIIDRQQENEKETEKINYSEDNEEWGKPEMLQQYGGSVITEEIPEVPKEKESFVITEAKEGSKQVDAVELEDDDIWMQPKHEYKVPEHWEPKSGRMWTTVFSEDSEQQQNEDKHDYSTYGQPSDISEDKWESQQKDISPNEEDVEQRYNNLPEPPSSQNYVSPEQQNNLISMYGKINDANYDIQMDDPMSPTFALSSSQTAAQKSAPIPTVILQKQQEIVEVELPNVPNIRRQEQYQQQNIPNPPEIKVTIHEEKDKDKGSDEESEEETSPSSDEDDYPDQIIEAPSAPSMSFTEMEHERETQSAFAQEVLQQIQSFGESANDEFDVQWAKKIPPQQQQQLQQQKQQKEENRQKIPTTLPLASSNVDQSSLNEEETLQRTNQRINPFLDSPDEEETDGVVVEQHQLDSDDIDYSQAAQYYRTYIVNDRIEQQQHQRKINTIPEGEEEENIINTEGRYHAKELERRPLHGNSVPPLVPQQEAITRRKTKNYSSNNSSSTFTPLTSSVLNSTNKTSDLYYTPSQSYYISAGTSVPTSTWTTTTKPITASPSSSQGYLQYQQQQQQQQQGVKTDSQIRISIPENSTPGDPTSQITPIRHAPPPPENGEINLIQNGKSQFKTDITVPDDLIPLQNHHPLHPHVHENQQTPQHAQYQHDFVPVNSASDAAFLAQIGVSVSNNFSTFDRQTLGSQLASANHAVMEADDDQITSRLKRSPAMILTNEKQQPQEEPRDLFSFPPPTYSSTIGGTSVHSIVTNPTSGTDGISSGVLMKRLFVSDEDALLPLSNTTATPTTTTSIEMGRRKLPSLPQPYMGTNSINAPIYYTSSGPEKNEIPNGIINTSGGSIVFDPSTASTTTRLTSAARIQPQISSSRPSSSLGTHPVDPSILPGATFKVMQKSRQITMIPNGDLANNKQKKLPKMTDTMSRVMLKKELREVLLKRRDKLDACEIEASNRQYVINRMLNSGILPENRLSELNEIPAVIKCDLPEDIVKGARVVPLRRPQIQTNIDSRFSKSQSQNTSVNWMHEEGTRQFKINTTNNRETKSIATQCEAPPKSVGTSTNLSYSTRYAPSTSLKQQIRAESTDFSQHLSKQRTVETQTDAIVDSTRPKKFPKPSGIPSLPIRGTSTAASGPDLLESTQRYFDEYDRRLKEAASIRLEKQRFNFTDNDIESKRQQILNELAQRREKISSMVDLRYLQQQPTNRLANQPLPSSDYASTVPHYGSLPRIDYPARNRISPNSQIRDFTARQSQPYSYSSLPRNYERNLNIMEQTLYGIPQSSRIPSNMSRSLYNLDQLDSGYSQYMQQNQIPQQQQQQPYARSSNYVDQLGSMDDLFTTTRNTNPNTGVDGGNMLSQYANYLNNQFLLAQQNQFEDSLTHEYNLNATLPPPSSFDNFGYEQQPSNLYQTNLQNQMLPNMPPPPTQPQIYDNFPNSQVYSRQEHNYGSRPSQFVGDYGNYLHNRAQSLRQLDNLQDFVNHNVGVLPNVGLPANSNPPTYGYYPSPWDNGFNSNYIAAQQQQQQPRLLQQQQQFQQQQQQLQQQPQYQPQMRSTTNTSYYDAKYPREDGLNRMYQTYGRRHRSPYNNISTNSDYLQNSQFSTSSLGRNMRSKPNNSITSASRGRSMNNIGREINDLLREHSSPGRSHRIPQRRIKRLLLTRRYKDTNVYNDLGIRVTGGKKLPNGDLGAFVTSVNRGKPFETLFEIQEGDQVLEWNGIILNGRTFEEVERIIASSKGEIEIIIKSNNGQEPQPFPKAENVYDNVSDNVRQAARRYPNDKSFWQTRSEAPPVPAHRSLSPNYYGNSESNIMLPYDSQRQYYPKSLRDGLGSIQIALSYDQVNSILLVTVVSARNLRCREYNNTIIAPNPFVKVYLLPGRKVSNKRRTKYISNTANPEWHQTVEYLVNFHDIPSYYLELTVWNYDKYNDNICLGQVNLSLSDTSLFNNMTRSYPLQSPDQASVIHGLNNTPAAPTTRLRTQSYYNPSSLDLGYPAIC